MNRARFLHALVVAGTFAVLVLWRADVVVYEPFGASSVPSGAALGQGTERGRLVVNTPAGHFVVPWVAQRGYAVSDGDIILGKLEDLGLGPRDDGVVLSLAAPSLGQRWPNAVIPFDTQSVEPTHPGFTANALRPAMRRWERVSRVTFRPKRESDQNWLQVEAVPTGPPFESGSAVGKFGGPQILWVQFLDANGAAKSTLDLIDVMTHELGHAIGFFHEQQRTDRGKHIALSLDCDDPDAVEWWWNETQSNLQEGAWLSPYDVASVMHYPGTKGCAFLDMRTCEPLVLRTTPSRQDSNSAWWMYPFPPQNDLPNDRFGEVVATGDFDQDRYGDLFVGAPSDIVDGIASGAVHVFKGTSRGLVYMTRIVPPEPEDGQEFGAAVAVADFDRDHRDEIAIGAPGQRMSVFRQAGAVHVFELRKNGESRRETLISKGQAEIRSAVEEGDRFGASLATGEFMRGRPALAIGAPGSRHQNESWRSGVVFIWETPPNGIPVITNLPSLEQSAGYTSLTGHTLASLPGDESRDLLLVSSGSRVTPTLPWSFAPNRQPFACLEDQRVWILRREPGETLPAVVGTIENPAGQTGIELPGCTTQRWLDFGEVFDDRHQDFGAAIAVGNLLGDSPPEVFVSAPQSSMVSVFTTDPDSGAYVHHQTLFGSSPPILFGGDPWRIGAELAIADPEGDGVDDLFVGAPGVRANEQDGIGRIFQLRNDGGDLVHIGTISLLNAKGLGSSLARLVLDEGQGTPYLVAGDPGRGRVHLPRSPFPIDLHQGWTSPFANY